jgi:hypothetical protein
VIPAPTAQTSPSNPSTAGDAACAAAAWARNFFIPARDSITIPFSPGSVFGARVAAGLAACKICFAHHGPR